MGVQIGSPYVPPDDVLLNRNSNTGAIQLKPGTRGDVLAAGASGVWGKLALGTSGKFLKSDGTDVVWGLPPGEGWVFLEKLSPSAVATITSSNLAAYSEYLVCVRVFPSGTANMQMQFNGDTAGNYSQNYIASTTITMAGGATSITLGGMFADVISQMIARINGVTKAAASGSLDVAIMTGQGGNVRGLAGSWIGGNATQISTITLSSSASFTGTIEIFGRTSN